jgi:2',3'-cyclic-nucleotide 2'-phosphodiesterase (5'-nucleotidase family)
MRNFPKIRSIIDRTISTDPYRYLTLNGDFLSPYQLSNFDSGKGMVELLNKMKFDFVCFGNHEFDLPREIVQKRINEFNGEWLSTNILEFSGTIPYKISTKNNIKILWLGLCMENLDVFVKYHVDSSNVIKSAKDTIDHLKSYYDFDYIIALTHQDYPDDLKLHKALPEIDLILGGHEHQKIFYPDQIDPVIIKTGMNANNIAKIRLYKNKEISFELISVRNNSHIKGDIGTQEFIDSIYAPLVTFNSIPLFNMPYSSSTRGIRSNRKKIRICQDILEMINKHNETDITVSNSGFFRGERDYVKNQVFTQGDLYNELSIKDHFLPIIITHGELMNLIKYSEDKLCGTGGYLRFFWDGKIKDTYTLSCATSLLTGIDNIPIIKDKGKNMNLETECHNKRYIQEILLSICQEYFIKKYDTTYYCDRQGKEFKNSSPIESIVVPK